MQESGDRFTWIRVKRLGGYGRPSMWHIQKEGHLTIDGYAIGNTWKQNMGKEVLQESSTLPTRGSICSGCLRKWSMNDSSI